MTGKNQQALEALTRIKRHSTTRYSGDDDDFATIEAALKQPEVEE